MTRHELTKTLAAGLCFGGALLWGALPGHAAPSATVAALPQAGGAAVAPDTLPVMPPLGVAPYRLAADDSLSIKVVNFPDLDVDQIVAPDGTITVSLLPPLNVTGKTTAEVAQALSEQWRQYVVQPSVTVALVSKRRQDVLFYGELAKAGPLDYRPGMHLLEALAENGGPIPTSDLARVTVTHADGSSQIVDLSDPSTKGGTDADLVLSPGDMVYVPLRRSQFSVLGEVHQPGAFAYKDNMTVLDALTQVGGVDDDADLPNSSLIHDGKSEPLDLDALLRHGDLSVNAKLAAGDSILVPEIHNRTYVFGEVGHPGYYPFKPGDRVLDALDASTPSQDADLGRISVIRIDKAKNTATNQTVDINKVFKNANMAGNVPLQPGDILYVPGKRHKMSFQEVIGALSSLSVVGNTALLLRTLP